MGAELASGKEAVDDDLLGNGFLVADRLSWEVALKERDDDEEETGVAGVCMEGADFSAGLVTGA